MNLNHAYCLLCMTLLIPGCTTQPARITPGSLHAPSRVPEGRIDFSWKLSGAREVAPLQVFSDHQYTWLHWHPNQVIPAIFATQDGQEHVLRYTRQNPYTIIEGQWTRLIFRAGRQQAQARRLAKSNDVVSVAPEHAPASQISVTSVSNAETSSRAYVVTAEDQNLRQALVRWSGISGWRFQPEHWSVDADIPLSAGASFTDDFVTSVQALLMSTELSDRPLQPCFYSNQVLRVVPFAEPCDRTIVPGASV